MTTSLAQRQQVLTEQIESGELALLGLQSELQKVDAELTALAPQRRQFHLLGVVCESLDELDEMGSAELFWGDAGSAAQRKAALSRSRQLAETFNGTLASLDQRRSALLTNLDQQHEHLGELSYHLDEVSRELENARYDYVVEREANDEKLFRAGIMPWTRSEEDRRRVRKALLVSLLFMLVIGGVPLIWEVPVRDPADKVEIPERLARMVKERQPPKPVEKPREQLKEEVKKDQPEEAPKVADKQPPKPEEVRKARARAETKGVLAHSSMLSDLMDDAAVSNLGADARISGDLNRGGAASSGAAGSRALIAASSGNSGAAAAVASVSRGGVGAGRGSAITGSGVSTGQVASAVAVAQEQARPLSNRAGPSRTDEEIQIVFDRHKSALYRLYNRELRNNPSLRGNMVLELTIEPDGSVSACRVRSTDMDSPSLAQEIVARVKRFNFGPKDGVPSTTIVYPIDFLPAG